MVNGLMRTRSFESQQKELRRVDSKENSEKRSGSLVRQARHGLGSSGVELPSVFGHGRLDDGQKEKMNNAFSIKPGKCSFQIFEQAI